MSTQLKDIYVGEKNKRNENFSQFIKGYSNGITDSFKFITKSNRMKSYIIFSIFFYSYIKIIVTYRSDLLVNMGVTSEQFSMIYAVLCLISAISSSYSRKVQRILKNKTLTVISLSHIISTICIGIVALNLSNTIALPIVLIFYIFIKICDSQWNNSRYTYLKNFTNQETRNKIMFAYELVNSIAASTISIIGALILNYTGIKYAILIIGLLFLAIIVMALDYMKGRFGLKPKEYKKEDLEFPTRS